MQPFLNLLDDTALSWMGAAGGASDTQPLPWGGAPPLVSCQAVPQVVAIRVEGQSLEYLGCSINRVRVTLPYAICVSLVSLFALSGRDVPGSERKPRS